MTGFLTRWGLAFVLLAATYNPTQWNYVEWTRANYSINLPAAVLIGLLLTTGYIIFMRATLRSIGAFGVVLVAAIFGALVWVLYDQGVITFGKAGVTTWIGLLGLSFVLGIGVSWSHVRRAISGQLDVDDADD